MAFIVSTLDLPLNARLPEIISQRIAPKLNRSERASSGYPRTCSGDMYPTVPNTVPGVVGVGAAMVSLCSETCSP